MASKDARRNAFVQNQKFDLMEYIDVKSFDDYIKAITRGRHSVYLFSGESTCGTLRIDWRKDSNANLIGDVMKIIDQLKDNSADVLIADPLFEPYYNPSPAVWEKAVIDGKIPESVRDTPYFGHPNLWQRRCLEIVKPGGILITKRDIRNTNVLTDNPQMFYVHDARPMAFIVRVDHK